jgi:hypothetical protein
MKPGTEEKNLLVNKLLIKCNKLTRLKNKWQLIFKDLKLEESQLFNGPKINFLKINMPLGIKIQKLLNNILKNFKEIKSNNLKEKCPIF